MNRFFCDMDGVVADYMGLVAKLGVDANEMKNMPGVFIDLEPMPGAIEGIRSIIGMGYDVFIATKPASRTPQSYADKASWILRHLPELRKKIIMTQDKGLLGDEFDYLLDDRLHVANCDQFKGTALSFNDDVSRSAQQWADVVQLMGEFAAQSRRSA